ncbi:MAG: PSP1 domain-containing protein [Weeksellaceae bacterium]
MSCNGCSTNGLPKGCKNNGACGTDGCDKLSVFDWLSNMEQPVEALRFPFVEVRFKNERKEFYHNADNLKLNIGDVIAVETSPGHDVGIVSLTGELVRAQMQKKGVKEKNLPKVYRLANQKDIDVWQNCREREQQIMLDARRIAREMGLDMKISDVEFQGDGLKAVFYYTSDTRVDFRQLIRDFASAFKCRIEMRQIGYRQESAKLGGIGSCGRELCCSSWLTDFRSVSTSAARYQQLSINPQKIAGQCGKLKCCLNYELDSYLDALKQFPKTDTVLETVNGQANCIKIDVFKREMWFAYARGDNHTWYKFSVDQVKDFLLQNKKGQKIKPLEELDKELNSDLKTYSKDVIEENSLRRFESKTKKTNRKPSSRKRKVNTKAKVTDVKGTRKKRYKKKNKGDS